ncbi:MAG: hypothetical protein EZS28_049248, partial [Streblomastix strix]
VESIVIAQNRGQLAMSIIVGD